MSDIKPKLILRPGVNISDKSPSPSTKLMLSHGKPNFTINRSKSKVDSLTPPTPATPEASQVVLKSTTFNGIVKPANLKLSSENEVNKVVLRRTRLPEPSDRPAVQDEEPEFIKAQRKIAERLAKENNLDFESRKSGYFTHVMMSPTSPNKPMELPVIENAKIQKATVVDAPEVVAEPAPAAVEPTLAAVEPTPVAVEPTLAVVEPTPVEPTVAAVEPTLVAVEPTAAAVEPTVAVVEPTVAEVEPAHVEPAVPEPAQNGDLIQLNGENDNQTDVVQVAKALVEEVVQNAPELVPEPAQNGALQNGNSQPQENGHATSPDVNFEAKTVTSFSKELSNEPNNYPDTVKITKEGAPADTDSELLQEMSKLKFDINADSEDVKVTPVLRVAE